MNIIVWWHSVAGSQALQSGCRVAWHGCAGHQCARITLGPDLSSWSPLLPAVTASAVSALCGAGRSTFPKRSHFMLITERVCWRVELPGMAVPVINAPQPASVPIRPIFWSLNQCSLSLAGGGFRSRELYSHILQWIPAGSIVDLSTQAFHDSSML